MFNFVPILEKIPLKKFALLLLFTLFIFAGQAQKYCYVDTEYILENMPEYAQAQEELNRYSDKWQNEIVSKYEVIDNMKKAYQAEKVLLTSDMKREREAEIVQAEKEAKELQKKRFSLNGDLFKKREELIQPVQDKIYKALLELAESGNYMVIFDKSNQSSIIFASPKYDKSDRILKKLGIKPGQTNRETKSSNDQKSDNKPSQNQDPGQKQNLNQKPNSIQNNNSKRTNNSIKKG